VRGGPILGLLLLAVALSCALAGAIIAIMY
jgi:hypothetical protein